jgi:hypothetical protein
LPFRTDPAGLGKPAGILDFLKNQPKRGLAKLEDHFIDGNAASKYKHYACVLIVHQ